MARDRVGTRVVVSTRFARPTLRLSVRQYETIVGHCYDGLPDEACGLLGGPVAGDGDPTGYVADVYPARNADASARTYTVDSRDMIRALRAAEGAGGALVGVWHSHTHTDAYPSDTDVRQAAEPGWVYVIVSLKDGTPVLRAYRIRDGGIRETQVVVERRA
ncbi:MAG TPA: M67 family metallopeptidase [Acidimicrobiia bacterium]|nr:M67 family metallopeptidase [Acidimicrobiia bacterium]